MSVTASGGSGGERGWQPQPCEPGEFPTGVWTPSPWQPYEDDPTCEHVPVEAKCADGWCEIPAGCFVGGASPDEYGAAVNATKYTVRLTRSFEMQQAEFGEAEWLGLGFDPVTRLSDEHPCVDANCPLTNVNWFSSIVVANAISQLHERPGCYALSGCTGAPGQFDFACTSVTLTTETVYECAGYRLPTQAEWEYAYRAGTQTAYYSGNVKDNGPFPRDTYCYDDPSLSKIGWYCFNTEDVQPSKCRQPNRWGLYDMAGNVLEWTSSSRDIFDGPVTDPQEVLSGNPPSLAHVVGGNIYVWPAGCAAATAPLDALNGGNGFRLVRTLNP